MPTESPWVEAKKSPVGEKDILVTGDVTVNTSIKLPVGISQVLIVQSKLLEINQRPSGLNAY